MLNNYTLWCTYYNNNILKNIDNEYIECKDSFEFNKGNYTIKQYENN